MPYSISIHPENNPANPVRNILYPDGSEGHRAVVVTLHGPGVRMGWSSTDDYENIRPGVTVGAGGGTTAMQLSERRTQFAFTLPAGIPGPVTYEVYWRDMVTGVKFASAVVHADAPISPSGAVQPAPAPDPEPAPPPALEPPEPSPEKPDEPCSDLGALEAAVLDLRSRVEAIEKQLGGASGLVGPHR